MLKLRLSDGRQEVVAFEYQKLPDVRMEQLAIGQKLLVKNPVGFAILFTSLSQFHLPNLKIM